MTQQNVLLIGESQTWNLNGYEITMTSENMKVGNGTLKMRNESEYKADSLLFRTHAIINGEDIVVHSGSVSGEGIDIAEHLTGTIDGSSYLNKTGDPITMREISNIYMIIEWWDIGESVSNKERIDLYDRTSKNNAL